MTAKKLWLTALTVGSILAGCAVNPHQNRLTVPQVNVPSAEQTKVAEATAEQMAKLWLPAKTTFAVAVALAPGDAFGNALVDSLRESGTGIVTCFEYREEAGEGKNAVKQGVVEVVPLAEALGIAKKLSWDFQPVAACNDKEPCLYRVSVRVDTQVLARAYEYRGGVMTPAGVWSLFTEVAQ